MSTIGTVPYDTSKYLVEIIQPTLNKNKHDVINSYTFVHLHNSYTFVKPGKYIKTKCKSHMT